MGTDCADCGHRTCDDSCASSHDDDCDDGGPGAEYSLCAAGTDCTDCSSLSTCDDSCASSYDGECDDGGMHSEYSVCSLGTDCADCTLSAFNFLRAETKMAKQQQRQPQQQLASRSSTAAQFALGGVVSLGLVAFVLARRRAPAEAPAQEPTSQAML